MPAHRKTSEDYLANTTKDQKTGCLEWAGLLYASGYPKGQARSPFSGQIYTRLTRFVLACKLGRDLKLHELALHTCDNPACLNPKHLYAGTTTDNNRDTVNRGRRAVIKLSLRDVRLIKRLHATGLLTQKELAEIFDVSQVRISQVVK